MTVADHEMSPQELSNNVRFLHAFIECSDEIQEGVKEMLRITFDPDSTDQERNMALVTVADALFPNPHNGQLGMDLEESEQGAAEHIDGFASVLNDIDWEEKRFAERLKTLMALRGMSQLELAQRVGVGQPAISNMLKRQCRPQLRTVKRLADALDVPESELWTERDTKHRK